MEEKRSSFWLAALSVFLVVAVALSVYVGGYFALGTKFDTTLALDNDGNSFVVPLYTVRLYRYQWLVDIYRPMAAIERAFRRTDVQLIYFNPVVE